jgi:hypothetical protein
MLTFFFLFADGVLDPLLVPPTFLSSTASNSVMSLTIYF